MIGKLTGILDHKGLDHIVLDVAGVGYVVTVSDRLLADLPPVGNAVSVHTDLLVREDLLQLFGFASQTEREWHRLLMSVQGIGAKASMAILGVLGADAVGRAIALGDWNAIAKAKGVGPKTAQRVVNELKDKAPSVMSLGGAPAADPVVIEPTAQAPGQASNAQAEALSALGNLGYAPGDAAAAVAQVLGDAPDASTSDVIRAALRLLAPKG